jgi:hypothetical protein
LLLRRPQPCARTQVAQAEDAERHVALDVNLLALLHVFLHQVVCKGCLCGGEADAERKRTPLGEAQHALRQRERHDEAARLGGAARGGASAQRSVHGSPRAC